MYVMCVCKNMMRNYNRFDSDFLLDHPRGVETLSNLSKLTSWPNVKRIQFALQFIVISSEVLFHQTWKLELMEVGATCCASLWIRPPSMEIVIRIFGPLVRTIDPRGLKDAPLLGSCKKSLEFLTQILIFTKSCLGVRFWRLYKIVTPP